MKERGILFSAPMVRALLAGTKTQTRRIVKPQPLSFTGRKYVVPDTAPKRWRDTEDFVSCCPYGVPGDRLWVRETWTYQGNDDGVPTGGYLYRADTTPGAYGLDTFSDGAVFDDRWRPAIHMIRKASRILLEVTEVRVQRLQEISEADAIAEGITPEDAAREDLPNAAWCYERLWERINGEGSWTINPFVWCVSFRLVTP